MNYESNYRITRRFRESDIAMLARRIEEVERTEGLVRGPVCNQMSDGSLIAHFRKVSTPESHRRKLFS